MQEKTSVQKEELEQHIQRLVIFREERKSAAAVVFLFAMGVVFILLLVFTMIDLF